MDWAFGVYPHDESWVLHRWVLREKGVAVWGPPPASLIAPVSGQELRAAVAAVLRKDWSARLDDPEYLRRRNYQAFAVLTMCRVRYTLRTGVTVSKPVAAAWARERLPEWADLIDRALLWRYDTEPGDMAETLAFVRATIEDCR